MSILFFIVAFIAALVSIILITVGLRSKVSSCLSMGGIILLITVATAVSYYFDWYIPLIIIFGMAGMMFTSIGTYEENSKDSTKIGFIESAVGVVLLLIAFYYWYRAGWYTSLGFSVSLLGFLFFLNGTQNDSEYIPVLSLSIGILFELIAIYLWIFLELNGYIVFLGGCLGGLMLKAMWSVFYEKNYWIKKRSYVFHDSLFYIIKYPSF